MVICHCASMTYKYRGIHKDYGGEVKLRRKIGPGRDLSAAGGGGEVF
jgi:hypothetical protein